MNTAKLHNQVGVLSKVGVVVGTFVVLVGVVWMLGGQSKAQSVEFVSRVPALQTAYEAFEEGVVAQRCTHIKGLAEAKLEEDRHWSLGDAIDRNDLARKRDMSCDF